MPQAFQSVAGYSNLPNGFFSSIIYSKKVKLGLIKTTVVGGITITDYSVKLSQGSTVRSIKEFEISAIEY